LRSLSADDFGISKEETELIRSQSLLNDHIKVRSCSLEALGVGDSTCNCIRCASQLFSVYYNAKGVIVDEPSLAKREEIICKECKYPEKVYYNPLNGSRDLTASLVLDVNSMNLVRRDRANQCSCCKRHYVGDDATCNVCGLVNRVVKSAPNSNLAEKKKAKALYKQYASVLPVLLRATYWGKKYCFEDDGIIVFVVGNRKYRFDKVNASPTGFIDSVKRMYR